MLNSESDPSTISNEKNATLSSKLEKSIDDDIVLSRKIEKVTLSAEAEEFRPKASYFQKILDDQEQYGLNNVPYNYLNQGYNAQGHSMFNYTPYPMDYNRKNPHVHASGSSLSNNSPSTVPAAKVIKIGESLKPQNSEKNLLNKNTEKATKIQKESLLAESTSTVSLPTLKQEKSQVSTPIDEGYIDVIKQFQEDIDEEIIQDIYGKEHVNVVFIGHVDAGKSTLGGNILYITGMVDKRTMEKYEKDAKDAGRESWYLSWALDSTKEERSKGKTVEVGRAYFETERRRYTILDAPGHKSYVPNMIEGTSQADVAVLVISARKGEYETGFEKGGQTREHAMLAKTQGVTKLIVVINKMDDPTVEWSKKRYDECTSRLSTFLKKDLGYNPKTNFVFMPISAFTGVNIKERIDKKICSWYDGPSLLEYLDEMDTLERKVKAPLMIPVQAKYRDMGLVIEGKIESGYVKKGSNLMLMPNKSIIEVIALYDEIEEVQIARCGEQVKLRIRGVEEEDVMPGNILSSVNTPVHMAKIFEAQIAILEVKNLLTVGYSCIIHVHTAVQEVTFLKLLYKLDKVTNRRSKKIPSFATKGMKIVALLETASPICLETFDSYSQLGRFILRNEGITVAIGKVTKLVSEE